MATRIVALVVVLLLLSSLIFKETSAHLKIGRELVLKRTKNLKREMAKQIEAPFERMKNLAKNERLPEWNEEDDMSEQIDSMV